MDLTENNLEHNVLTYLQENLINETSSILVGLSGGPDSTALLFALAKLRKKLNFSLEAAYINHGMRASIQLTADDNFVKKITDQLNIKLFSKIISPGKIDEVADKENRSSEDVAREYRYSFFKTIHRGIQNSSIALGHNLDDQFETMIIRYFQGAGLSGLKGIPHRNQSIIRPLMNCRKIEILDYLKTNNQQYRTDSSNMENMYLRNQVRNTLIPQIEKIFPGYSTSLTSLQKKIHELDLYFHNKTERLNCFFYADHCEISIEEFNQLHKLIRINLLYKMFDHTYGGSVKSLRVPEGFFNQLLTGSLLKNKVYAIGYSVKIQTNGEKLIFRQYNPQKTGFYHVFNREGIIISNRVIITFETHSDIKIETIVKSPLILRSRKKGDVIYIKDKYKEIKNIFSQWEISDEIKNRIPLIEDSLGIIAVLGEIYGYKNIFRNKKINSSGKFNILYLGVRNILQE